MFSECHHNTSVPKSWVSWVVLLLEFCGREQMKAVHMGLVIVSFDNSIPLTFSVSQAEGHLIAWNVVALRACMCKTHPVLSGA